MYQFIIATHGLFAEGIKNSIEIILGKFENLSTLSCYTKSDFNLKSEIDNILKKYNDKKIIVITDIFGGSVNNLFMEEIPLNKNIHLITGLNLPLVLNLLGKQENYLIPEELIQNSMEISSDAVKYCNLELIKTSKNEDEDF